MRRVRLGSAVLCPGSSLFSPPRRQQPPKTTTFPSPGVPKSLNWPQGHPQGQALAWPLFCGCQLRGKLSFEELALLCSATLPPAPQSPLAAQEASLGHFALEGDSVGVEKAGSRLSRQQLLSLDRCPEGPI